jgi:hypothetical protein
MTMIRAIKVTGMAVMGRVDARRSRHFLAAISFGI